MVRLFCTFSLIWLLSGCGPSEMLRASPIELNPDAVFVCTVLSFDYSPPQPSAPECVRTDIGNIDPQGRTIWVLGSMTPSPELFNSNKPVGLFLGAKAASQVTFNGIALPSNGAPRMDRASEIPGLIDFVSYIPRGILRPEDNEVALLLSGHHTLVRSSNPLIYFKLNEYFPLPHHEPENLGVRMVVLGLILLTGLYSGTLAVLRSPVEKGYLLLCGVSALTALHIGSEAIRTFWVYPYPFHDLRLAFISGSGLATGLLILAYISDRLGQPHKLKVVLATAIMAIVAMSLAQGFHGTAATGMLVPKVAAFLISIANFKRQRAHASVFAAILFPLILLNINGPQSFLDQTYFIALATLITALTVIQADAFNKLLHANVVLANAKRELELQVGQPSNPEHDEIVVRSAGSLKRIPSDSVAYLKSDGNYTLIARLDGTHLLASSQMGTLEKELPACFIRVHRSHIINIKHVSTITRHTSGVGEIALSNGMILPVSRRALPTVRKVLLSDKSGQIRNG